MGMMMAVDVCLHCNILPCGCPVSYDDDDRDDNDGDHEDDDDGYVCVHCNILYGCPLRYEVFLRCRYKSTLLCTLHCYTFYTIYIYTSSNDSSRMNICFESI